MNIRYFPLFFIIVAVFMNGCSSSSTGHKEVDVTPPLVPVGLAIPLCENGAVTLTWEAVADRDLAGYNIYWLGESEVDTLSANKRFVQVNTATIAGLDYDILYYFAVSSVDNSGNESALSMQTSGKPLNTTSPTRPVDVQAVAENIEYAKITVFWSQNNEPDLDHYKIYRATQPGGLADPLAFISTSTQEHYADIMVDTGVTYYYRITAVDKGNWEGLPSETTNDIILPPVELLSPVNYQSTGKTPTFVWEGVDGAVSYKISMRTSRLGDEIWNINVAGDNTQITYNGRTKLINGNTYYWQIGAISRTEINSISEVGTFVVRD